MTKLSTLEVEENAKTLQMVYSTNLKTIFRRMPPISYPLQYKNEDRKSTISLLEWLLAEGLQTIYPKVHIALRMCVYYRQQMFRRKIISCLRRVKMFTHNNDKAKIKLFVTSCMRINLYLKHSFLILNLFLYSNFYFR